MTIGSDDAGDPHGAVIQRGRLVLEALRSREQAALYHAAYADLQVALVDAEAGNEELLRRWLDQYRTLIDKEPELRRHFASVQDSLDVAEQAIRWLDVASSPAATPAAVPPASVEAESNAIAATSIETAVPVASQPEESSWSTMVIGARRRRELRIENESKESQEGTETGSLIEPPLIVPPTIRATLDQERKDDSKKKWTWLSSSLIGSTAAHLIALIAMSTYMIQMARKSEPRGIVASSIDTETVSMDVPMEMSALESPTVDLSETTLPALSSLAEAVASSSSSVQLPSSMAGLVTSELPASVSQAVEQAMSSAKSNTMMNSVEFFGVKAAGNTFCYVVDSSASMKKDGAFAAAKAELVRSLALLKPKQRFYIAFFGGEIERLKLNGPSDEAYPVYATKENLQKALLWIESLRVQDRGMPPSKVLAEAIEMDPDGIFLLFDGDTKVDVAADLRKVNRSADLISAGEIRVPIHTIGFYTQEFEVLMKRIAVENRGTYRFVPNPMKKR